MNFSLPNTLPLRLPTRHLISRLRVSLLGRTALLCCGMLLGIPGDSGNSLFAQGDTARVTPASETSGRFSLGELPGVEFRGAGHSPREFGMLRLLVKSASPAVAHIEAKKTRTRNNDNSYSARAAVIEEAGSGVVIRYRNRNFVVTNYHVIEGAELENIQIVIDDYAFRATDVRHDKDSDVSVLLMESDKLSPARLGDSDHVEIGDNVVAIGSPFGLSHSVSQGIISAKFRHDLELGPQGVKYQDFFQTDASINPGNSGGPLFNLDGEVIGMNTAIASNSGGSDGIGFAIPINMVMRIVTDLVDVGYVKRGFLGVSMDGSFSPRKALEMGFNRGHGALISAVTPGGPADAAGIKENDLVIEFNGRKVLDDSHLVTQVSLARLGDKVPVKLLRKSEEVIVSVEIREKSE
ncbi:MAG: S1C family serine protease [Planctomycetota bacterium]